MNFKDIYQKLIDLDRPLSEDNATALKGVYNQSAFQQGEKNRADSLAQSTDPDSGYTSAQDPIGTVIRHSQSASSGKQGALGDVRQIAMFDDPKKIIQLAVINGATEQEILQALPKDFDLSSAIANYNPADSSDRVARLLGDKPVKEGLAPPSGPEFSGDGNYSLEECGDDMPQHPPAQSDSVTMNVSMNGSGKGGIRDLMNVLKNIEDAVDSHQHNDEPLYTEPVGTGDEEPLYGDEMAEEFANTMDTQTMGMDAMFQTGDDLHSKGIERPKVNGGGNPMQEALVNRLYSMYSDISESKIDEISKDTLGSYVKRAASDLRTKSFNRGLDVARNRTDPEELEKDAKKVDARHTGIMKAASRLQNKS